MADSTWLKNLAETPTLWNEDIMDCAPSVIAHEYYRLRQMAKDGEVYGIMFELRDLMESIIKLHVLLMAAFGEKKEQAIPGYVKDFVLQKLTMGAWYDLGNRMSKLYNNLQRNWDECDVRIVQNLRKSWSFITKNESDNHWINWRNQSFAHGALAFSPDKAYEDEIRQKLEQLKKLLDNLHGSYSQIKIKDEHDVYSGYQKARQLGQENGNLVCQIGDDEFYIGNYILHRKHGIYFFDSLLSGCITNCLNYVEGDRWIGILDYWTEMSKKCANLKHVDETESLYTEYITAGFNRYVNQLSLDTIQQFVVPVHLHDWLRRLISCESDNNDFSAGSGEERSGVSKGVFLLLMDRGCGKTAFTEKLNCLYDNPLLIAEDLDVRTYHISRTQTVKGSIFQGSVAALWRDCHKDTPGGPLDEFDFIIRNNEDPAKAFAAYLNSVQRITDYYRGKKRILFILDGLDEIIPEAEQIWDYIPSADQLDDGVYVLLTGRNVHEPDLSMEYAQRIEKLKERIADKTDGDHPCVLSVFSDGESNRLFLRRYIHETLNIAGRKFSDDESYRIAALADNRVLYARMYVQLLSSGKCTLKDIAGIEAGGIVPYYMDFLKGSYGERGWKQIVSLLTVFATMYDVDSLTLEEIAWLLGENQPTLQLLGMISDISCMLNVERGYTLYGVTFSGENQYRMANKLVALNVLTYLRNKEKEKFFSLTEGLIMRTLILLDSNASVDDGYLLMLSCFLDYSETICQKPISLNDQQKDRIVSMLQGIYGRGDQKRRYKLAIKCFQQLLQWEKENAIYLGLSGINQSRIKDLFESQSLTQKEYILSFPDGTLGEEFLWWQEALGDANDSVWQKQLALKRAYMETEIIIGEKVEHIDGGLRRIDTQAEDIIHTAKSSQEASGVIREGRGSIIDALEGMVEALGQEEHTENIYKKTKDVAKAHLWRALLNHMLLREGLTEYIENQVLDDYNESLRTLLSIGEASTYYDIKLMSAIYRCRSELLADMCFFAEAVEDLTDSIKLEEVALPCDGIRIEQDKTRLLMLKELEAGKIECPSSYQNCGLLLKEAISIAQKSNNVVVKDEELSRSVELLIKELDLDTFPEDFIFNLERKRNIRLMSEAFQQIQARNDKTRMTNDQLANYAQRWKEALESRLRNLTSDNS